MPKLFQCQVQVIQMLDCIVEARDEDEARTKAGEQEWEESTEESTEVHWVGDPILIEE